MSQPSSARHGAPDTAPALTMDVTDGSEQDTAQEREDAAGARVVDDRFERAMAEARLHFARAKREGWSEARTWADTMCRQRRAAMLDSEASLAAYLLDEATYWLGHALTTEERATITATAREVWADRVSQRAVPTPAGITFAVCAYAPCRRTFEQERGCWGAFCSPSCLAQEVEQPGTFAPPVRLGDDEAA